MFLYDDADGRVFAVSGRTDGARKRGRPSRPSDRRALSFPGGTVRKETYARILPSERAAALLVAALKEDPAPRLSLRSATNGLERIGYSHATTIQSVMQALGALTDPNLGVRQAAAEALHWMGPDEAHAINIVTPAAAALAVEDEDSDDEIFEWRLQCDMAKGGCVFYSTILRIDHFIQAGVSLDEAREYLTGMGFRLDWIAGTARGWRWYLSTPHFSRPEWLPTVLRLAALEAHQAFEACWPL